VWISRYEKNEKFLTKKLWFEEKKELKKVKLWAHDTFNQTFIKEMN